jgi:hypothetical protein
MRPSISILLHSTNGNTAVDWESSTSSESQVSEVVLEDGHFFFTVIYIFWSLNLKNNRTRYAASYVANGEIFGSVVNYSINDDFENLKHAVEKYPKAVLSQKITYLQYSHFSTLHERAINVLHDLYPLFRSEINLNLRFLLSNSR